jgi:hypothetical protein
LSLLVIIRGLDSSVSLFPFGLPLERHIHICWLISYKHLLTTNYHREITRPRPFFSSTKSPLWVTYQRFMIFFLVVLINLHTYTVGGLCKSGAIPRLRLRLKAAIAQVAIPFRNVKVKYKVSRYLRRYCRIALTTKTQSANQFNSLN